jgi:hypothetical protein
MTYLMTVRGAPRNKKKGYGNIIKTIDIKNSRMNSKSLGLGSGEMRVDLKDDRKISAEV